MKHLLLVIRVCDGAARAAQHLTLLLLFISSGCLVPVGRGGAPALNVLSDDFVKDGQIPVVYTCDGTDISPPLSWGPVPQGAASIAILVTDPDAPEGPSSTGSPAISRPGPA